LTSSGLPSPGAAPTFDLPRPLLLLYAAIAIVLSLALVGMSSRRGTEELSWWLAAYGALAVVGWRWPGYGPLAAGGAAFVLGFARTWRHGVNLDLGLGLLLLAIGLYLLRTPACHGPRLHLDAGGLLLLFLAVVTLASIGFTAARIRAFVPAPGFGYHVYRLNALGLSSEEALSRGLLSAALTFSWFGAYVYGRAARVPRRALALAVFSALLLNSAALLVQTRLAPDFLHPAGWYFYDRWNGVTSFCWALGDAALAFFLLLPLWGSSRGRDGVLTVASLLLVLHGVVASGSRTALGAMLVATLLWAGVRVVRSLSSGRRGRALLLGGSALLLVGALLLVYRLTPPDNSTPLGRLKEGFERQGLVGHLVATRLGSYPLTLRVVGEFPWTGIGAGLYPVEVEKYRALLLPESRLLDPLLARSNAPNQFLNLAAELGLPAALFLLGPVVFALWSTFRTRHDPLACDLGVSTLVLLAALQLGPGLYNSEALLFEWLLVGGAVAAAAAASGRAAERREALASTGGSGTDPDAPAPPASASTGGRRFGSGVTWLALGAVLGLAFLGQLRARGPLSVEQQWRQLRWRLNIGLHPPQEGGQWTAAEATLSTDAATPAVLLRWHAGDRAAPGYEANVSFFVDGAHVATTSVRSGVVRETRLPLPVAKGFKRISVRVEPPFVPARELGGDDDRRLGIFVHSITPQPPQ